MLVVHHLNNSRSQRILWLLEELELPYEIRHYERHPKTMRAPDSLKQVHPLGKSPVLSDGELVLAESGAILEYLLDTYGQGRFRPAPGSPERLRYNFWMHYAEGSLMPPLLIALIFTLVPRRSPFFLRWLLKPLFRKLRAAIVDSDLARAFAYIEGELGLSTWLAGSQLTAADIQMSFPLEAGMAQLRLQQTHPRILAFLERMKERPAFQRALQRGGPYSVGERA
ncbi:MAG: glutathione S-transferase [Vulcanimicrobiota bacterium]